jgi:K+-transporting ATPase KdpF subunit
MGSSQIERKASGGMMYIVAGVITLGLLIYLFAALLKPEAF